MLICSTQYSSKFLNKNLNFRLSILGDFPGGPAVKTLPSNAGGVGSIPGPGAETPHALRPKNQNRKHKQYCNKFNKDFKIGPHQKKKSLKKIKDYLSW